MIFIGQQIVVPIFFYFFSIFFFLSVLTENYSYQSGTSHIVKIEKLGSWAHETADSHQISYLSLYASS